LDTITNNLFFFCAILLSAWCCITGLKQEKNWVSPLSLFSLWVLASVVLDGLYTFFSGTYGLGEDNRIEVNSSLLALTVVLWLTGTAAFFGAYRLSSRYTSIDLVSKINPLENEEVGGKRRQVFSWLLIICAILSFAAVTSMVSRGSSLGLSILQISGTRNLVIADGGGPLLGLSQVYKYALLIVLFHTFGTPNPRFLALVPHALLVCALDLLLGARSALIYGLILPALMGYHIFHRPIALKKLIVPGLLIIVLISPVYRSVTRDVYFAKNKEKDTQEILVNNLQNIPQMIFGGFEVSSLDASIDVLDKYSSTDIVTTDLNPFVGFSAFIPRFVWPEKPYGGASTSFTKAFYPRNYGTVRSELLASFVGEMYMNFGFLGVPLGFGLLGTACGWLYRRVFFSSRWPSRIGVLLYTVVALRLFNLLRGDTFNFMSQLYLNLLALSLALLVYWVINFCFQAVSPRHTTRIALIFSGNKG